MVPAGSVWKYLDNGTTPGAWYRADFDDRNWTSGPAQLGYGEGDEATVVSYGPDAGNKYVTTYFRHSWIQTNAAAYSNLTLRLLRDDGAVVYLNGMEVARAGMPPGPGPITSSTLATENVREDRLYTAPPLMIMPGLLVDGTNVLAVEIHQATPSSSDISFDLELSDEPAVLTSFIDLASNSIFASPANLSFTAKAASQVGVTNVDFYLNGLRQTNRDMVNNLYAQFDCALAIPANCSLAVTARDRSGATRTAAVEVVVEPNPTPGQVTNLISTGEQWRFLDDGSDQGIAWRSPAYNDTNWSAGPAILGHNRPGISTPTRSGTVTTYFRRAFNVSSPAQFKKLFLRILRDDGVKIYLNGAEVFCNNLSAGQVTFKTRAPLPMETTNYLSSPYIDAALLVSGQNVIAVEMHQASTLATKQVFDLELLGLTVSAPPLSIRIVSSTNAVLAWPYPSTGFRLMESASLNPADWTYLSNQPAQAGDQNELPLTLTLSNRFYQLRKD